MKTKIAMLIYWTIERLDGEKPGLALISYRAAAMLKEYLKINFIF